MSELNSLLWWAELARNLAIVVASGTGAYVALKGLNAWKREREWDKNERLAANILSSVYSFREALYQFRRESFSEVEQRLVSRPVQDYDSYFEAAMAGMNPFYQSRLNGVVAAAAKLRIAVEEARFHWREPFPQVYSDILAEETEIRSFLLEYYGGEIVQRHRNQDELNDLMSRSEILILWSEGGRRRAALLDRRIQEVQEHLRSQVWKK